MKKLIVLLAVAVSALTACTKADYTGVILAMGIDGENYTFAVSAAEGTELVHVRAGTAEEALEKAAFASPRRPVYGNSVLILVGEGKKAVLPEAEFGATVAAVSGSAAEVLKGDVLRLKRLFAAAAEAGISETSLAYARNALAEGKSAEVPFYEDGAVSGKTLITNCAAAAAEVP